MRLAILFIFFTLSSWLNGQIIFRFDTIAYHDRMNGTIDSIDISGTDFGSTFDGGNSVVSKNGLSTNRMFNQLTQRNFSQEPVFQNMYFSALPHLGFFYSFGGQGSQFLNANYNHAFNEKMVLDIRYKRNSGLGLIRNSDFSYNDVQLQFQRNGLRYSFQIRGSYSAYEVAHSGGLVTDTLIEDFGLEFSSVNKTDAHSRNRVGLSELKNYFNFLSDSTTRIGIVTAHAYSIRHRVYTESDTLYGIYPSINIDSLSTRDQYNLAKIRNGAGLFYSSRSFYIDALIDYMYWDYQNLGEHSYRNEYGIASNAHIVLNKFELKNKLHLNLVGAFNEWSNDFAACFRGDRINANAFFIMENLAPTPLQRSYFGNHTNYNTSNLSTQSWLRTGIKLNYPLVKDKIIIEMSGDYTSVSNFYYFSNFEWQKDSLNINFTSVSLSPSFHFGAFNFNSSVVYSIDDRDYLPDLQIYGRLFFKGKLFKAKKLEALIGVDASYVSSFSTRTYIPLMDTYDWTIAGGEFTPMANLHAFLNLAIDEFRFFVRYENIGYLWADKRSQVVSNYPIGGTRLRIGLTWDFFN